MEFGFTKSVLMRQCMNPLISIVTINYNNAEGLRKTIQSVLSQADVSLEKIEYIVVDGGSKDGSVEVIEEFEKQTDLPLKISKWVSEPDKGIYNAMNKGIRMATGELVGILNSGDWFNEDVLSKVLVWQKQYPKSILYGVENIYADGEFSYVMGNSSSVLTHNVLPHESVFIPKKVYDEYGYYDESYKIAADYEAILRFYLKNVPFVYLNLIVTNFTLDGISATHSDLTQKETESIWKKYGVNQKKNNHFKNFIIFIIPPFFRLIFGKTVRAIKKLIGE